MKLFYIPGACSLASHILLTESGAQFQIARVDPATGLTDEAQEYSHINPLGFVPALQFDDGKVLLENGAILAYLAEKFGFAGNGDRFQFLEEISYLSSELHKAFSPFFADPDMNAEVRAKALEKLHSRLKRYEDRYAASEMDAAKVYAFVITGWAPVPGVSLDQYPKISAMREFLSHRPAVKTAMAAEGLS